MTKLDATEVRQAARGQWVRILESVCGLDSQRLNPKIHGPCPKCGGTDRFRALDDVAESGALFCNQCHNGDSHPKSGDGLSSVQWLLGCGFSEALRLVAAEVGGISRGSAGKPKVAAGTGAARIHATPAAAADALAWGMTQTGILTEQRKPDSGWRYRNADDSDAGAVFRWDLSDGGKEIRQVSAVTGGWICKAIPEPRPLYRLPQLLAADASEIVWIIEGEKAADVGVRLGLCCVTSSGGSNAAEKTDWKPVQGRRIVIVPDNDEPGEKYAADVARLCHAAGAASVAVLSLPMIWPHCPPRGDLADFSEAHDGQSADTLRAMLDAAAVEAVEIADDETPCGTEAKVKNQKRLGVDVDAIIAGKRIIPVDTGSDFEPFPIAELGEGLSDFCQEVAESVGCDPAFPAVYALAVSAAAIGASRQICLKEGWFAPCILWTLAVGESGSGKSPPYRLCVEPLQTRQSDDDSSFQGLLAQFNRDQREHKHRLKRYEQEPSLGEPVEPTRPVRRRCLVADASIEAVASVLAENPRGVLVSRDELSSWLAGFDKYKARGAASSEVPQWLEMYSGETFTVDRKTGDSKFLLVRDPHVSITGGIQPGILRRCMTTELQAGGLQSRFLMVYPPRGVKKWRDAEIRDSTRNSYRRMVAGLFELKPSEALVGASYPATLTLSSEARGMLKEFVNAHGEEQSGLGSLLASHWSKLEEIPGRLAMILHCVRQVLIGVCDPFEVQADVMARAIRLTEFFKSEAIRIHRLMSEPEGASELRALVQWIYRKGGRITARDLHRGRREIPNSENAEQVLMDLVNAGCGRWESIRGSREFVLTDAALSTRTA